jgi:endonuclease/exonuclease/phosphatase (EEP) superfamily protein YafD
MLNLMWFFTRILCVTTLLAFSFGYWLKPEHWLLGFVLLAIQILLYACFAFALLWLFKSKLRAFYPIAVLLLGFPFLKRTVQFHALNSEAPQKGLSILSFNVNGFYSKDYYKSKSQDRTLKAINFSKDFDADIKCFEDFYNWDETPILGTINKIKKKNLSYFVAAKPNYILNTNQGLIGLVIFSKYPIVNHRQKMFGAMGNGILYADILYQNDTIRVFNTQLQSMGVRVNKVFNTDDYGKAKKESKTVLNGLKVGFEERFSQVNLLHEWIKESPYPIILCGDFNEVPYGFAYGKVSKLLKNSFEDKGYGFGFTLNRSPRFVRIDNQFYGKGLKINKFETLNEVEVSDHFPIYAEYEFIK